MTTLPSLPIVEALPELGTALEHGRRVVLEAPPGAGKSTVVPITLLDAGWRGDGRVVMLEPRRIAARAVAERMAALIGERTGARRLPDPARNPRRPCNPPRGRGDCNGEHIEPVVQVFPEST